MLELCAFYLGAAEYDTVSKVSVQHKYVAKNFLPTVARNQITCSKNDAQPVRQVRSSTSSIMAV